MIPITLPEFRIYCIGLLILAVLMWLGNRYWLKPTVVSE